MSFVVAFHPFMGVRVVDDGPDGGAPVGDLAFVPTPATRKAMADHAILFRAEGNGFSLYYRTNPAVTPALRAPIAGRVRFGFAMRVRTPGFFERFHPDLGANGAQVLLDNLDGDGAIEASGTLSAGATVEAADLTAIGPEVYPVRLAVAGGAPGVVEARDRFTDAVVGATGFEVPPNAAEVFATIDLTGSADAALRLTAPAPATLDRPIYADDALARTGAAGAVDLHWDQPQDAVPAGTGAEYSVVFRRR